MFLHMCRMLVDEPESVVLEAVTSKVGTVFHLHVSKRDLGKIIGKQGRIAQALRLLLASSNRKYTPRADLIIHQEPSPIKPESACSKEE